MSLDELIVLIGSFAFIVFFWGRWVLRLGEVEARPGTGGLRVSMVLAPVAALAGLFWLLTHWAAHDVTGDPAYIFFYLVFGAAWMGLGAKALGILGLPMRDDVCERGNPSAAWALCGGLAGVMSAYAGANIGDGPGWWCVAFAGGLATAGLLASWALLDRLGGVNHSVTVDRDPASGLRLGSYLLSSGLVLGRAAAGDWTSASQTVREFAVGWPVLLLTLAAVAVERLTRPSKERPNGSILVHGWVPAVLYLLAAIAAINHAGPVPGWDP